MTVECEEETPANFFLLAEEVEDGKVLTRLCPNSIAGVCGAGRVPGYHMAYATPHISLA